MVATALHRRGCRPVVRDRRHGAPDRGPLGGSRDGAGRAFVAEADESDGSFLAYAPLVAVVTNVEPDHLDHYGSAEAFEDAFVAFAERIRPGGALVACADDAGAVRSWTAPGPSWLRATSTSSPTARRRRPTSSSATCGPTARRGAWT